MFLILIVLMMFASGKAAFRIVPDTLIWQEIHIHTPQMKLGVEAQIMEDRPGPSPPGSELFFGLNAGRKEGAFDRGTTWEHHAVTEAFYSHPEQLERLTEQTGAVYEFTDEPMIFHSGFIWQIEGGYRRWLHPSVQGAVSLSIGRSQLDGSTGMTAFPLDADDRMPYETEGVLSGKSTHFSGKLGLRWYMPAGENLKVFAGAGANWLSLQWHNTELLVSGIAFPLQEPSDADLFGVGLNGGVRWSPEKLSIAWEANVYFHQYFSDDSPAIPGLSLKGVIPL